MSDPLGLRLNQFTQTVANNRLKEKVSKSSQWLVTVSNFSERFMQSTEPNHQITYASELKENKSWDKTKTTSQVGRLVFEMLFQVENR